MDEVNPARFKPASKENMREVGVESGTKNKCGLLARSYRSTTGKRGLHHSYCIFNAVCSQTVTLNTLSSYLIPSYTYYIHGPKEEVQVDVSLLSFNSYQ